MAVLSKTEINRRRGLAVDDASSIVITPLLDPSALGEDSVDLRLGTHFLMPQVPPQPFLDPNDLSATGQPYLRLHAPLGSFIVLPAHQTVLGATLEYIKLPFDVSGQILTKSSIARTFMIIETAPWIHPSYRGCLTLEIANVSNTPIVLYPGNPIGQLVLLNAGIDEAPKQLSGSYIGPVHPEPPLMNKPGEVLRKIGLSRYRHPLYGWVSEETMRNDIEAELNSATDAEKNKIKAVVRVLKQSGGIAPTTPVDDLLK